MTHDDDLVRVLSALDSTSMEEPPPYAAEMLEDMHALLEQRLSQRQVDRATPSDLRVIDAPSVGIDPSEVVVALEPPDESPRKRWTERSGRVLVAAAAAILFIGLAVIATRSPADVVSTMDDPTESTLPVFDPVEACADYAAVLKSIGQLEDDLQLELVDVARVDAVVEEVNQLVAALQTSGSFDDAELTNLTLGRATLVQARTEVDSGLRLQAARTVFSAEEFVARFDLGMPAFEACAG